MGRGGTCHCVQMSIFIYTVWDLYPWEKEWGTGARESERERERARARERERENSGVQQQFFFHGLEGGNPLLLRRRPQCKWSRPGRVEAAWFTHSSVTNSTGSLISVFLLARGAKASTLTVFPRRPPQRLIQVTRVSNFTASATRFLSSGSGGGGALRETQPRRSCF